MQTACLRSQSSTCRPSQRRQWLVICSLTALRVPFPYFLSMSLSVHPYCSHWTPAPVSWDSLPFQEHKRALPLLCLCTTYSFNLRCLPLEGLTVQFCPSFNPSSKDSSSLFSLELNVRINFSFSFIHSFIQQLRRECLPHGRHSRLNNVEQNEDPAFLELTFWWGKQMLNKMNKWVNPRENQRVVSVMEKHTEQDTEDGGNG